MDVLRNPRTRNKGRKAHVEGRRLLNDGRSTLCGTDARPLTQRLELDDVDPGTVCAACLDALARLP